MIPEKWETIKSAAKKNFTVEDQGVEDLIVDTSDGPVKQGEAEFVIFDSPLGKTKLQFQKKPKLVEKQYHYSHRSGTAAQVEYKFSEEKLVYTFKAYKWDDTEDKWREISPEQFQ